MMIVVGGQSQTKTHTEQTAKTNSHATEVLMIGTFHFNNPGFDVVKTKSFDILKKKSQEQLEEITSKIEAFNPSKIFLEQPYNKQEKLDSQYSRYLNSDYFDNPALSDFYRKSETFQLGFRVAKKLNLKKIYAADYTDTTFPYESVMSAIADTKQEALQAKIDNMIKENAAETNARIDSGATLKELLYWENKKNER